MASRREKVDSMLSSATYHVFTNAVNDCGLFLKMINGEFMDRIYRHADFCGVKIITAEFLKTHWHMLVHVPKKVPEKSISDDEWIARLRKFYGEKSPTFLAYEAILSDSSQCPQKRKRKKALRRRLYRRIFDISVFMKEFKQALTALYKEFFDWRGTLWR